MRTFDDEFRERKVRLVKCLESFGTPEYDQLTEILVTIVKNRRHVHVFGNGGSYAQASHFIAELVGQFEGTQAAIHGASVLGDAAIITALVNDLEAPWKAPACVLNANGQTGDLLVVLSTSGTSKNIVELCRLARCKGIHSILLTGDYRPHDGNERARADFELKVPSVNTATIQEVHMVMLHAMAAVIKGVAH